MSDYFFVPMNDQQIAYWERKRRGGMFSFVLLRGLVVLGIGTLVIACMDVSLSHTPLSAAFISAIFESLFWAIAYPLLEWSSYQRRYRKTMEKSGGPETAKVHAMR